MKFTFFDLYFEALRESFKVRGWKRICRFRQVLLTKLSNTIHILFVSAPQIAPIGGTTMYSNPLFNYIPSGSIAPGADGELSSSGLEVTTIADDPHS